MRYSRYALAAAAAFAVVALADEVSVPDFSSPPAIYKSRYGDELLVGDRNNKSLKFWVNVEGANGHQCYMVGNALSGDNETYRAIDESDVDWVLDIILVDSAAVLIDSNNACHDVHCGSRAYLNGNVFRLFREANSAIKPTP